MPVRHTHLLEFEERYDPNLMPIDNILYERVVPNGKKNKLLPQAGWGVIKSKKSIKWKSVA